MASTARVRTEPGSGGFMRSVMRHHNVNDLDDRQEKKSSSSPVHLPLVNDLLAYSLV
jgi:hypothetical protein